MHIRLSWLGNGFAQRPPNFAHMDRNASATPCSYTVYAYNYGVPGLDMAYYAGRGFYHTPRDMYGGGWRSHGRVVLSGVV